MKQLIVLISTVVLGVFIAGMIIGFKTPTEKLAGNVTTQLESVFDVTSKSGIK